MPRTFSPRPTVSVAASNTRDADFANGSNDVQQQLKVLNAEAKEVSAQLKAAWDGWRNNPGDKVCEKEVQSYERRLASLDERRKDLEAQLSGGGVAAVGMADQPLQNFRVKLRELRAAGSLEVADYMGHRFQVINLSGGLHFPGEGAVERVLRRDCYAAAHLALKKTWAAPGPRRPVIVTGTPGTGKTVYLYDVMFEYALHDHPILWHSWELPDTLFCFGPDGVREGNREAFKKELLDPDAIYLCDSVAPFKAGVMVRPRTVIAVSPNRLQESYLNDLVKTAKLLWFPAPSDKEMYAAAPFYDVDDALCKQLMCRWGNVPRYVLQHAHNEEQQALLDYVIGSVSIRSIEDAVRNYGGADQLTAKLVHVRATPDLTRAGVKLASPYVQLQLYERLSAYEVDAAKRLVEFCTGLSAGLAAGAGGVHQGVAHRAFMRGGSFLVRDHQGQRAVIQLPNPRVVQVDSNQEIAGMMSWWETSSPKSRPAGIYALPTSSTFAALDSAIILSQASPAAPLASGTSSGSFSSALSSILNASAQMPAAEPLDATDTDADEGANTATLGAGVSRAATAMDKPIAAAASAAAGGKPLVLGVQITTNPNHKINFDGWKSFSSETKSRILAFAVPPCRWSTYPRQKFDGGPADAEQQAPCDQLVITWVPTTKAELNSLPVHELSELGKAFGIKYISTLPKEQLVQQLLKAKVPTADFSIVEEALQKVTEAGTKPQPAAGVANSVASAAGLPAVDSQKPQGASSVQQFSKKEVMSWPVKELRGMCSRHTVSTKDANGKLMRKAELQARFISALGIDG